MLNEELIILVAARQKLILESKGTVLLGGPWFKKIKKEFGLKANTRKDAIEELHQMVQAVKNKPVAHDILNMVHDMPDLAPASIDKAMANLLK